MAAKDFGIKYVCFKCSTKFYDMKKPDPLCPKCGADQRDAGSTKTSERKSRLSAAPKIIEPVEPAEGAEASEEEEIEAEGEEEIASDDED